VRIARDRPGVVGAHPRAAGRHPMNDGNAPKSSLRVLILWFVVPFCLLLLVAGLGLDQKLGAWLAGLW